jgi:hypothetical protein
VKKLDNTIGLNTKIKMINLIVTSVGDSYNKEVLKFINSEYSKNFNLFLLTDNPKLFHNINTTYYYKEVFSYFEKFLFGLKILNNLQEGGFIWDADELHTLESDISRYDTESDSIQFAGHWDEDGRFSSILKKEPFFWSFLFEKLKLENLTDVDFYTIQEDKIWFPKKDYTSFLNCLESLHIPFMVNSIKNGTHKNGIANGEGIALGYSIFKTNMKFKSVYNFKN